MKEYEKPFIKVVVLKEGDIVCSSHNQIQTGIQGEGAKDGRGIKWSAD